MEFLDFFFVYNNSFFTGKGSDKIKFTSSYHSETSNLSVNLIIDSSDDAYRSGFTKPSL